MGKQSAGLLMYRFREGELQVFLVHPGGPYWAKKDEGAWSIPKGEFEPEENPLAAACREFTEETGFSADGDFLPLTPHRLKGGKTIHAWAFQGDCNPGDLRSNLFSMEWPPRSGKIREFPEVDRGAWFSVSEAKRRMFSGQLPFLAELERLLAEKEPQMNTDPHR